jgi:hypothetical protein
MTVQENVLIGKLLVKFFCKKVLHLIDNLPWRGASRDGRVDKNIKHIELFILYEMQLQLLSQYQPF